MQLDKELIKLGLTDKESKVYLAGIQLGPSTVQKISQKSGVNRATTYVIIESLMQMGLMSTFDEGKKTFYAAEKPKKLVDYFEGKKRAFHDKVDTVKGILPELQSLFNDHSDRPRVKYYEGVEGLKTIYNDFIETLKEGEEVLVFVSRDEIRKLDLQEDRLKSRKIRSKKGIKMRVLYNSENGRDADYESNNLADDKFTWIDEKDYKIGIGANIYGNKVILADYKGKTGAVMIENAAIANFFKSSFNLIWRKFN